MSKLLAIAQGEEVWLRPVNTEVKTFLQNDSVDPFPVTRKAWIDFEKYADANQFLCLNPTIKPGDVVEEGEFELIWQWLNNIQTNEWEIITPSHMDAIIAHSLEPRSEFRQVYIRKQPAVESEEPDIWLEVWDKASECATLGEFTKAMKQAGFTLTREK